MSMALLIIGLVLAASAFMSFLLNRRKPTSMGKRITWALAAITLVGAITLEVLDYRASTETDEQLHLVHDDASETREKTDRAQADITEIRTPRRIEYVTERVLVAKLEPYAGQKYDLQVFRDHDSLELASAIQGILEEAGWVYTNVYPKQARYAETREEGLFVVSRTEQTGTTPAARKALRDALTEAGLYNDSSAFTPVACAEITGPPQVGTKITKIPCSESWVQIKAIHAEIVDDVIPADTLVLRIGKRRL